MPAVSYRIYFCPPTPGEPAALEFPTWWKAGELFTEYRHREVESRGLSYDDTGLLLTLGEALVFDRHCREQFSADPRSRETWAIEEVTRFDSACTQARWVVVEAYEWESGLD